MKENALVYGPILFVMGLVGVYAGIQKYLFLQKINNTPTSKVRSAAVGLVELFGKAVCKDSLSSPLTKQKCVFWKIEAAYYHSGKHSGWRKFFDLSSSSPFYLEDDTGRMLIKPGGEPFEVDTGSGKERIEPLIATVEIPVDNEFTGYLSGKDTFGDKQPKPTQAILDFISKQDQYVRNSFSTYEHQNMRVQESYIAEGDPIYVLGTAQPIEGASSPVSHENLFMGMGKQEKVLYISDSNEKKITEGIGLVMPGMLFGGLAFSAIGLLLMLLGILGI